jgi:methionine synthase / methylenetetrahydrofolate reductase (NADH)
MSESFSSALASRVLVCDGAMGTMLYGKGVFINKSFDALNLTAPELVGQVHQEYVRAGADIVETNTFGANRIKLASFGIADQMHAINREGARIARAAAQGRAFVAGAIGPLGVRIEPWGKTGIDQAREAFEAQVRALVEGGVDLFVLETFRDLNEIGAAIDAVRRVCDLPIVAQMTTEEDGNTLDGTPPERFAPDLERRGATVIGVNCAVGPAPMLETIERMSAVTRLGLSAQPNAGRPRDVEGRNLYLCSPEYMASYARRFILHNVRVVGGCCGTTPEHIRQIKAAVRSLTRAHPPAVADAPTIHAFQPTEGTAAAAAHPPISREEKSRLAHSLAHGRFVVAVEVVAPRGVEYQEAVAKARALKIRGIDAVSIADGHRSGARVSGLSLAVLIEQQAGIETLVHYACRDRNLLGIQADLLGAHAMGLRNLMLITGDPSRIGDYPDATAVFDVDSIGLTNLVSRLNHGCDVGGQPIGQPTRFHVGVSVNPAAPNMDEEFRRFDYKLEAGAEFAVTWPVFDVAAFEKFMTRAASARIPIVAGILPFESARHAEFFANEVPGSSVPERLLERMRRARPEDAAAEGVSIASEIAREVRRAVRGVHIATTSGHLEPATAIVDSLN